MSKMNLDTLVTFHFKILLLCQNYTLVIIIPPTFNYKCDNRNCAKGDKRCGCSVDTEEKTDLQG